MADIQLLLEAERRGILPADKKELLDEARNRVALKETLALTSVFQNVYQGCTCPSPILCAPTIHVCTRTKANRSHSLLDQRILKLNV